jgi:hypothetical protein
MVLKTMKEVFTAYAGAARAKAAIPIDATDSSRMIRRRMGETLRLDVVDLNADTY